MTQYINKSALVAEIKRQIDCCYKICAGNLDFLQKSYPEHYYSIETYKEILSFINTLEVKEVDFVKEFYTFSEKHKLMDKGIEFADIEKTASFFFQLGLKAAQNEHKSCTTDE